MTTVILKPSKDTKWLTLEVCKDYAKGECEKSENDCKFAHPPAHVEASNGKVICCFDSIKSKCQRTKPPCKYLHPPAHLKEQLLEMGRQNLIFKNLQLQSVLNSGLYQPLIPPSNSQNYTHHQNPSLAYPLGATAKTTILPPSHQTLVLPQHPYEMSGNAPLLQPAAPTMPLQPYQLFGATPQPTAMLPNGGLIQLVNPPANYIYLNGATPPLNSTPTLAPSSLTPINQNYPGLQILPYNESLLPQQQYPQRKLQHPQAPSSNYWDVRVRSGQVGQQNARKRGYQSSSSPLPLPSSSSSSSASLHMTSASDSNQTDASNFLPCPKKPALVDLKGGIPIYAPSLSASFPSNPQFIPISITPQTSYIHRL